MADAVTKILSLLTLISLILVLIYFLKIKSFKKFFNGIFKRKILFSFIVSMTAVLGSLYYSDIVMLDPCKLCWYQRIFMYPQALMFGVALWFKDNKISKYAFVMSIVGGLIAAFHYIGQNFIKTSTFCLASGEGCSKMFFFEFGFITLPMMAFVAFLLLIILNRK